ncbi:phage tail protein [Pseudomonas sp. NPDC090755]|uniref:phage tail protein n=1 Tax=Pseudomonas sp. NPDC090755 TaxID=3364481 RepID=UPI00383B2E55
MTDQTSQYFAILTAVGEAKQANANALGVPWTFSQMGVGDANLTDPTPSRDQKKLINERRRAPLNQVKVDPDNASIIIAEQVIPPDVGGWWIREIGLYDADGDLVAVANCAPSFKPLLSQGTGKTQVVRLNIIVTSAANVQLKVDPAVVLATRAYVDGSILEVLPKNKAAGEFTRVKINDRGVVLSGDNPSTLAANGITDAYTKEQVDALIAEASALPVGAMVAFPVDKMAPGFLELDGSVKSSAIYPSLSAFLGTVFNKGDEGPGNFRLPESRAEFLRGWDHGRGVDAGRVIGNWQADETRAHSHSYNVASAVMGTGGVSNPVPSDTPGITKTTNPTGGTETRPRNLAVMWCIKAWNTPINEGNIDIAALAESAGRAIMPEHMPYRGITAFSTAGVHTWAVPDGVSKAWVTVIGGGGGGGRYPKGGGGGGAGGVCQGLVNLSGVNQVTVTVGVGGIGRTGSEGNGGNGGTSSFGSFLSALPGGGATSWCAGVGGTGVGGNMNWSLGNGANQTRHDASVGSIYGGGAGGGGGGLGSGSSTAGGNGGPGTSPGSGGGGGNENGNGGNGAPGLVMIGW